MNEQQARYVRKLKVDQQCSLATVARLFYEEYGSTPYCNKSNAESAIYFDNDTVGASAKFHNFSDGEIPVKNYHISGFTFSKDVGKALCDKAMKIYGENYSDGWADFDPRYIVDDV
jgi:hypothetical protein